MRHAELCPVCNGSGKVIASQSTDVTVRTKKCHGCNGKGWVEIGIDYSSIPYISYYTSPWTTLWVAPYESTWDGKTTGMTDDIAVTCLPMHPSDKAFIDYDNKLRREVLND